MSGECYPFKSFAVNVTKPEREYSERDTKSTGSKPTDLLGYETMVSSAESKCTQLRGQLERMKEYYSNQSSLIKSSSRGEKLHSSHANSCIGPVFLKSSNPKLRAGKPRQNSHQISTDRTGTVQGAINNILAGITKSMPIPDLAPVKPFESNTNKSFAEKDLLHGVEDVKIQSKSKPDINNKSKPKMKVKSIKSKASTSLFRKTVKVPVKMPEKRAKISTVAETNQRKSNVKEKTKLTIRHSARHSPAHQDLVEIYHNTAVKESRSSDSDVPKKISPEVLDMKNDNLTKSEIIPPLNIEKDRNEAINRAIVSYSTRNYTMPTISSRMKRVAKYYMNSFNIKSIPFCPVTSTSASHNIGINIQQVMNMVKIKQPVGQLSPTLAYNIALAANKWNTNPLSMLVANTSRTIASQCPLAKNLGNFQHLQEMAKNMIEEVDENDEVITDSPETQSMIITGPSGDVKVTNRKPMVWTGNADDKKCTCVPQKGIEIQQIINKFNGSMSKSKVNKSSVTLARTKESKMSCTKVKQISSRLGEDTPLHNKERKLKEVLVKLHDEFEKMTQKYDDLAKQNEEEGDTPEVVEQLENLDKELTCKEEEIVMVMTLYKEVLALKDQVKALKERSSKDIISIRPCQPKVNSSEFSDGTTANLLSKLLNRIQHFQTHYKKH